MTIGYVGLVLSAAGQFGRQLKEEEKTRHEILKQSLERFVTEKSTLEEKKKDLADEAFKIFTLYEMTKEITRQVSEEEAFEIFKRHLSQHVILKDCRFLEPLSTDVKGMSADHFIFTLQDKRGKIGFLAIEGLDENDQEKVVILGHQFALALRRVNLYREIEKIAITDSLTDVHTRRHLMERLQEELSRSKARKIKMSVLMIDVDHFKSFNDQYGHLTGDQILRKMAQILKENIREIDIAGRFGGEEFCVLLPDTDRDGAQYAAERIRQATEKTAIEAYDNTVKATVSIGLATFPKDGQNIDELIEKADQALYQAKQSGRNRVC